MKPSCALAAPTMPPQRRQRRGVDHVHLRRADELGDELVRRPVVQLQRRADLLDHAVAQHHDAVGQRHRLDLVVRDVDRGRAQVAVQLGDLDARLAAQRRVEVGQRLVEQEDLGRTHDGAADRDPLALAARQVLRRAVQVLRQVQDLGRAADLLLDLGLVDVGQPQRKRHVVGHAHVRVQRVALEHHRQVALARRQLGDVAPVELDAAAADLGQPGDHAQQRRLAAARRADEDDELALLDRQVHALDDAHVAVGLLDILQLQIGHDGVSFI